MNADDIMSISILFRYTFYRPIGWWLFDGWIKLLFLWFFHRKTMLTFMENVLEPNMNEKKMFPNQKVLDFNPLDGWWLLLYFNRNGFNPHQYFHEELYILYSCAPLLQTVANDFVQCAFWNRCLRLSLFIRTNNVYGTVRMTEWKFYLDLARWSL